MKIGGLKIKLKKISAFMSTMLLTGTLLITGGSNALAASNLQSDIEDKINVMIRKTYKIDWNALEDGMTKEDWLDIYSKEIPNWTYNEKEDLMEEYIPFENSTISVESLSNNSKKINERTVLVTVKNEDNIEMTTQKINLNDGPSTIVIDIAANEVMQDDTDILLLDENNRASSTNPYWEIGESGSYGKALHCNRFNGKNGNNKYYPKTYPQALINFVLSDCDYALGKNPSLCANDYSSDNNKRYCSAAPTSKNGKCSTYIGHYNKFHFH